MGMDGCMARTGGRRVPWRIYPIRVPYTVRGTRYHAVRHPTRSSFYLGRVE